MTVTRSGYGDIIRVIFSGDSRNDTYQLCSELQHLVSSLLAAVSNQFNQIAKSLSSDCPIQLVP